MAFTTSLMIHAMLLIALPLAIDAATPEQDPANQPNENEQVMVMPVELELGIDAPTPPTPTWIGHEKPEPQKAEPAEFEQAAFTDQPVAAAPPPSESSPPPTEEQQPPVEPQQPAPAEAAAQDTTESVPEPVSESAPDPSVAPEELSGEQPVGDDRSFEPNPRAADQPPPDVEAVAEAVKDVIQKIQKAIEEAVQAVPEPTPPNNAPPRQPSQQPAQQPSPQSSPPQPPQPPKPQVAPEAQDAPPEDGTPSDKESPPTSIIDVPRDQWELGKPLARHGLLLKPRRPEFTLLTMLTSSPGNPLCQMDFDRQGIPIKCALLRSSGDKRVDDAVLASLYRWRAEGAELAALTEGKTLPVRIRIVLNKRALASESETPQTAKAE